MRRQGNRSTAGGAKGKAASDPAEYFDHLRVDEATVKELTRRLISINLLGTDEGRAGVPGGRDAQATDLVLLAWALADATEQGERDDILEAVKQEAVGDIGAAWRAVADSALERLTLITGAARKGAGRN